MIVDLTQIENEAFFEVSIEPSDVQWDEDDVALIQPLMVQCRIKKGDGQVKVEGNIKTILKAHCSRCFEQKDLDTDINFIAIFVNREKFPTDEELELHKEDLDVSLFEGEELNLAEVAREQILISLPTRILCSSDCKGLCGICWTNLNTASCKCHEKEIDLRFAKLKELNERRN